MKKILFFIAACYSICTVSAQDAKSLIGKWRVLEMHLPGGKSFKINEREKVFAEMMKESKKDALQLDNEFSEKDSLDAATECNYLVKGMFDAVQEYQPQGVYVFSGWNEKENWAPVTYKGTYSYVASTKKLSVTANGKTKKYTLSKMGDKLKFSMPDKGYLIMEKITE